jgi:hypothetical protein
MVSWDVASYVPAVCYVVYWSFLYLQLSVVILLPLLSASLQFLQATWAASRRAGAQHHDSTITLWRCDCNNSIVLLYNLLKNTDYYETSLNETCSRITLGDTEWAIKMVPMGTEAVVPLMHQQMDAIHKQLPCFCWNHCTTEAFMSWSDLNLWSLGAFLRAPDKWAQL